MNIKSILDDKGRKPKEKTEVITAALSDNSLTINELIEFAVTAKDPAKATCIEAVEDVSQKRPEIVDKNTFTFMIENLSGKAPRVRWESAKVIGNTAHLHMDNLDTAIVRLLDNTKDPGTVVRWSAAFALSQILKLKTERNNELIPTIEALAAFEENNGVRKHYTEALKKVRGK